MWLARDVHCGFSEAVRAMQLFAMLYGESGLNVPCRPGIEFICEPLDDDLSRAMGSREVFFAHRSCAFPFQIPTLSGVVSACPNGLTTTITFDVIYETEIGIVGALFDRCVGRRLARGSATAFFQRLLRFIEQEAGLDRLLEQLLQTS